MKTVLEHQDTEDLLRQLKHSNSAFARRYPGASAGRQPVHTVYGGAHLFKADVCRKLGDRALRDMETWAPDADRFGDALGLSVHRETVFSRVRQKLEREPVEDYRIDFEDGYGIRADAEEDGHAVAAADEVASAVSRGLMPAFLGLRIKPLSEGLHRRSIRTLDLFCTALAEHTGSAFPRELLVTLPKATGPEQVAVLAAMLERLEARTGAPAGSLKIEIMIEAPQVMLRIPELAEAAGGRCAAAHFGSYDFTASLGITAAYQQLSHPACDFARHLMKISLAGTGIRLSDGVTNILPIPPHRRRDGAPPLSASEEEENRAAVHRGWRLHYDHVRRSLANGFYQSWDVHPAQLPARYAAVYAFFLEGLEAASVRLRNFLAEAAQATRVGTLFDDAATGHGLINYFRQAVSCGAIPEQEISELTSKWESLMQR